MSESLMPWDRLIHDGKDRGLLAKRVYAVNTTPVNGLERCWLCSTSTTRSSPKQTGSCSSRVPSRTSTRPSGRARASVSTVWRWLLNEGTLRVHIRYSTDRAEIL